MAWISHEVQKKIKWRDDDIVVSVPVKSGTTWTANIVHQLMEGGTEDFDDIYTEIPWIEFVDRPGRTTEELVEKIDAMPTSRRRAFKTHSAPGDFPYFDPVGRGKDGSFRDVKYVVVVRCPDEALASFYPFLTRHKSEFVEGFWGLPPNAFKFPDFETYHRDWVVARDMDKKIFDFMKKWWPKRKNSNVLLLHYNDMKKDHDGTVERIRDFLGYAPSPDQWEKILEYTSFPWMKLHEEKFECQKIAPVEILEKGSMMRRGESGLAEQDGVTEEISRSIASRGREVLQDEDAFWFLYKGSEPLTQTPAI
uniref:Sulfotransferase domain-containing protein n=1 Tax=Pseudictyota dubia TaxID=2749911 RepID=A0A7R9W8I8_9STRA|mmetsp:Transcript_38928/g.71915  ORF Transcript_38928/g.71915 Transcript_38928/m.71915 type:complete len:308 (+) Transcript_38928:122-1045(+)